ncbi:hypothetical protein GCM10009804_12440 [Kribbella hippodromi]|uniref:DUF3040 domain-containing protein n=1 Tax=Kribbella hippodromi TaxID=434347 RepID=A0ABN2CG50_9ACTN
MRREDVQPLLLEAADLLPDPNLADAAWAGGLALRRTHRRIVLICVLTVIALAILTSVLIEIS